MVSFLLSLAGKIATEKSPLLSVSRRSWASLADQHRAAIGGQATYATIADYLAGACQLAEVVGLDLSVSSRCEQISDDGMRRRYATLIMRAAKSVDRAA